MNELEEKEAELSELLDKIDELQAQTDQLADKIASQQKKIRDLRKQAEVKGGNARSKRLINHGPKSVVGISYYEKFFSGENLDFIIEKHNRVIDIESQINSVRTITQNLQEEVDNLESDMVRVSQSNEHLDEELSRTRSERQQLTVTQQELETKSVRLKGQIDTERRLLDNTEKKMVHSISKAKAVEDDQDEGDAATKRIKSLNVAIDLATERIIELQDEMKKFDCLVEDERPLSGLQAGWSQEEKRLRSELQQTERDFFQADNEFKDLSSSTKNLEEQYNKIEPLARKWKHKIKKGTTNEQIEASIEDLLKEYHLLCSKQAKKERQQQNELEEIIETNTKLEETIDRLQRELYQNMDDLRREELRIKASIRDGRTNFFDQERGIIQQMLLLKIQAAQARNFK